MQLFKKSYKRNKTFIPKKPLKIQKLSIKLKHNLYTFNNCNWYKPAVLNLSFIAYPFIKVYF